MKLILNSFKRKLKTQRIEFVSFLLLSFVFFACSSHSPSTTGSPVTGGYTDYASFVSNYEKKTDPVAEIYGQYSARQSDKKVRAKFNLLVDPGKRAYIEILDPSDRLLNVLSLSRESVSLLWPKENAYIQEQSTPENLKAVIGLPIHADDALQLLSGHGLQFSEWKEAETLKDGWKLSRGPSFAKVITKEDLCRIETTTKQGSFLTSYEKYEYLSDKSFPTRIRFEIPERKTTLELRIDKYLPRTEEPSADVFELKLPANAKKLALNEIYRGKPLLLE